MAKQSVYLDSTIPSAYYDSRTPERQGQTLQFWHERLTDFEVVISSVVLLEIRATPDEERRRQLENLVKDCEVLVFDEEADALAQEYVGRGVFPQKYVADGNHVAVAATNGIEYFCSWNFTHLVNVNIRREVNLINSLKGYGPIEIIAPPELWEIRYEKSDAGREGNDPGGSSEGISK